MTDRIRSGPNSAPVIVVLGETGFDLAQNLRDTLPNTEVHGLDRRVPKADVTFSSATDHIATLFADGRPIIGICAAGILIRAVANQVGHKDEDPPVIAIAEDGSCVIPLLGGHRGANQLARRIADRLGVAPAVTTASDVSLGGALDDPPEGWRVSNPAKVKELAAAILGKDPVCVHRDIPEGVSTDWLPAMDAVSPKDSLPTLRLTDKKSDGGFALHPAILGVGIGCEKGASVEAVEAVFSQALETQDLSSNAVACIATIDLKEGEPGIIALAHKLDVPLIVFSPEQLEAEAPRLANPSDYVFETVGCHGVAEGAALATAGEASALLVEKFIGDGATCAIARAPVIIDPHLAGRPAGWLAVVGIGPGDKEWRSPEASAAIAGAEELVGYSLYIDLLEGLAEGKPRHDFPLGEEIDRVDHALKLTAEGKRVALICSGDAGIYAMASLVYERMALKPEWQRLQVRSLPGISAMQAASARAGAALGHDFCTISLSDLMTPWPAIEARIQAAAEADFVVAFYNPASARRRKQLDTALAILRDHRPAETPVVVGRNLGRDGEEVRLIPLSDLRNEDVDMLTVLIVGNSESQTLEGGGGVERAYTPRGYAGKERQV